MATFNPAFHFMWDDSTILTTLLSHLDTPSVCALRLTSSTLNEITTHHLFARTNLTLTPSSLTRPCRLEALSRIGHHIRTLNFSMPHTPDTFLPPLLNPVTGQEVGFLYTPNTSTTPTSCSRPKYGSPELGELLTQQYPPIFHAATNVAAFIAAMEKMPNLRHLSISCPGQDPSQRYRRDAVDYALISLRIGIERAPLLKLEKLTLRQIHPSSLLYFRHLPGFGCTPSAARRWRQIRKLSITMDAWDFGGSRPGKDHLRVLDSFIRDFSPNLEKMSFGWNGRKGPCPLTLFSDPMFASPRASKLFGEVTSPMSPLPAAPCRPAMNFPKLKYMQVRNALMSAEQVAEFILEHRHTVKEFDFENVALREGGDWDDALAPLTRVSGSEDWMAQGSGSENETSSSEQGFGSRERLEPLDEEELEEALETSIQEAATEAVRTSIQVKKRTRHRRRRRKPTHPASESRSNKSRLQISDPIPISVPIEEVLIPDSDILLKPVTFNPNAGGVKGLDPGVQGVQRNAEMDERMKELADDPEKRESTLQKAKARVLKQLGREFCGGKEKKDSGSSGRGLFGSCGSYGTAMSGKAAVLGTRSRMFFGESSTALVPLMFSRY